MKYFALLILLFVSTLSFADAWDNLTHEEATKVVNYLNQNPYVFDFCDCCQSDDDEDDIYTVQLIKVTNVRIVPCNWDKDFYSVEYDFQAIAEIIYKEDGSGKEIIPPYVEQQEEAPLIYMNYTWGFNSSSKLAKPLFESIDYHYVAEYGGRSCKEAFSYPTPKELNQVGKFKAYKQWWKKAKPSFLN